MFSLDPTITIFTNESLPEDVTVTEGQSAAFHCQAKTTVDRGSTATLAFFVRSPDSPEPVQCLNCSFLPSTSLFSCTKTVKGDCSGLTFFNSSSGLMFDITHHFTARWDQVTAEQNESEVTCAIAVRGMTQWQHSATLIVNRATPVRDVPETNDCDVVLMVSAAVVAVAVLVIAFAVVLSVVILCAYKRRNSSPSNTDGKKWQKAPTRDDMELMLQ